MSHKRILVLGLYPIVRAQHGGSRRARAVVREYQRYLGNHVRYAAVFSRASFPQRGWHDIPVSMETDQLVMRNRELEDIICGRALYADPAVKKRLTRLLLSYRPDVLQLEQVYAYLGLKPLLDELGLRPKLVYDAHNAEGVMKAEVYARSQVADVALAAEVIAAEEELARVAEFVLCVSEADAAIFRGYGAQKVIVARNGAEVLRPSPAAKRYWKEWLTDHHIDHAFSFVSSAHLPNWYGLKAMMGEGLGFLPPNARLIIVGAMSDYLLKLYQHPRTPAELAFLKRVVFAGRQSDDRVAGLLASSQAVLLPITDGGGSNLKTAQALLSGRPVVATSFAFRSFEAFRDLPTVRLGDSRADFQEAIAATLIEPTPALAASDYSRLDGLTWSSCLHEAVAEVGRL